MVPKKSLFFLKCKQNFRAWLPPYLDLYLLSMKQTSATKKVSFLGEMGIFFDITQIKIEIKIRFINVEKFLRCSIKLSFSSINFVFSSFLLLEFTRIHAFK